MNVVLQARLGRRMAVGRYTFDPKSGRMGICGGYCPNCQAKIMYSREELQQMARFWSKDEKSYGYRLLKHLLAVRSV